MEAYDTEVYKRSLAEYHLQQRQAIEALRAAGQSSVTIDTRELTDNPLEDTVTVALGGESGDQVESPGDSTSPGRRSIDSSLVATPATNLTSDSSASNTRSVFMSDQSTVPGADVVAVNKPASTKRQQHRGSSTRSIFRLFRFRH